MATLYHDATGYHEIPTTTTQNAMGQTVTSFSQLSKIDPSTGKLVYATPTPVSSDRKIGTLTFPTTTSPATQSGVGAILGTGAAQPTSSGGGAGAAPVSTAGGYYQDAIKALLGGVDAAKASADKSKAHITNASSDLGAARGSAAALTGSINGVNAAAQDLSGYASILKNLGLGSVGIGDAIVNGDKSGGGLVADFLSSIGLAGDAALKITPDRYVSMAAADTQSSFQNALQQSMRNLSRTGVSPSSGAAGALQNLYTQSLATALASAKTKARQAGLTEQLTALTNRAGLYSEALKTGVSVQAQGAQMLAQAAGIVEKQGDLFATAGQLGQAQSAAYANIGGVEVNLGQLELSNNNAVQNAINSVASAQLEMAKYYADMEPVTTTTTGTQGGKFTRTTTTTKRG